MLRKLRLLFGIISFILITLLFLDFTGSLHKWFDWLAKIQFLPALLALNTGIIIFLVVLTLLFGRIYCSVICPLGVFQDGASRLSRNLKKKKRYRFSQPVSWLRYGVLALCILAFILGLVPLVALLDPYGIYGRIANNLFQPLYQVANNILASFAERIDSYTFYPVDVWIKSGITFFIALATFIVIGILAWRNGRTYCNTICPVGTVLGFLSRFSLFKLRFDTDKCTKCGLCERNCKASCIDSKKMFIDHSRCVTCFNCIEKCKFGAMRYAPVSMDRKKDISNPEDSESVVTRRNVLSILGMVAITQTVKAQQLHVDGGLADIEDKKVPERKVPVVPPGAHGQKNFSSHCTACQLCVSVCPNNILRPSNKLSTLMQPEMSYERGYCRPECTKCSNVCPTNAIKAITTAEKTAISIGQAIWIEDNCVVNTDKLQCTACEQRCPTNAITLISINPEEENQPQQGFPGRRPTVLKIPTVNKELCIGCGACEYYCPARPFSAIYVEGNVRHHAI